MGTLLLVTLVSFFIGVLLLLLSIPLHELSHVLAIWSFGGGKTIKKITLLKPPFVRSGTKIRFGLEGEVEFGELTDFSLSPWWKRHLELLAFLIGLSGGGGAATVLGVISIFLFLNPIANASKIWILVLIVAGISLFMGFQEAFFVSRLYRRKRRRNTRKRS